MNTLRRFFSRIVHWVGSLLFGYDFFISYSWNDPDRLGRNYAQALKNRLTDLGYVCFLDSTDYEKGADWQKIGRLALSRTRKLLLVATPAAFHSEPVHRELRLFRRTGRDIIPIDIAGTLTNASINHELTEFIPGTRLRIAEPDPRPVNGPSDQVLQEVRASFNLTRQKNLRRRIVAAAMVLLALLTVLAETQREAAVNNAQRARHELLRANINLADAHQQKSRTLVETTQSEARGRDWQRILLHALQAQRQSIEDREALTLQVRSDLVSPFAISAFTQRWHSPAATTGSPINDLVISPAGERIVTGHADGIMRIWDLATGTERLKVDNHQGAITALSLSSDGTMIASGDAAGLVRLWDPLTGVTRQVITGNGGPISAVAFDPSDRLVAIGIHGGSLRLRDWRQQKDIWRRESRAPLVTDLHFSADGTRLWVAFSGEGEGAVQLLRSSDGELKWEKNFDGDSVEGLALSRDEQTLFGTLGDSVHRWNAQNGEELGQLGAEGYGLNAIAIGPTSGLLVVGTSFGTVRMLDPSTGTEVDRAPAHNDVVSALAFSADGKVFASGSHDGELRVWEASSFGQQAQAPARPAAIRSLKVNDRARLIATGSEGGTVHLWDLDSGRLQHSMVHPHPETQQQFAVTAVAFTADGMLLAAGDDDGQVLVWDSRSGEIKGRLRDPEACDAVNSVAFSPDGKLIAAACMAGKAGLWDTQSQRLLRRFSAADGSQLNAVAFSADGSGIIAAGGDGAIQRWDRKSGRLLLDKRVTITGSIAVTLGSGGKRWAAGDFGGAWSGDPDSAEAPLQFGEAGKASSAVALDGADRLLAIGYEGGAVTIWEIAGRLARLRAETNCTSVAAMGFDQASKLLAIGCTNGGVQVFDIIDRHLSADHQTDGAVLALEVDRADSLLVGAVGSYVESDLRSWDLHDGSEAGISQRLPPVWSVSLSQDGERLAAVVNEEGIQTWNLGTRTQEHLIATVGKPTQAAFHPAGEMFASGTDQGIVQLWDASTGTEGQRLAPLHAAVTGLAFDSKGTSLAIGLKDGTVRIWERDLDQQYGLKIDYPATAAALAFGPQDTQLTVGYWDGSIRRWDLSSRTVSGEFNGHSKDIKTIAIHPRVALLASGSWDTTIRLWDTRSGTELARLIADGTPVFSVRFLRGGNWLASGSGSLEGGSGTVRLWDLRPFHLLNNGTAPSPRAALISETLQRLWGLRLNGLEVVPETWHRLTPRDSYYVDQQIDLATEFPALQGRIFDIRPLLDPPPPGKDKLDQFLDWLAEQEPRLRP